VYDKVDTKTSTHRVKTITPLIQHEQSVTYFFPPDLQAVAVHPELKELTPIKAAINALKTRSSYRNVLVALPDEVSKLYFDACGNVIYKDYLLEEYIDDDVSVLSDTPSSAQSTRISPSITKTLHTITKDIVINKFSGKGSNISAWLTIFERECKRVGVGENKLAEALRLFLEGMALDWFSLQLKLLDLSDPWQTWKDSMIEIFGDKGWTDIRYAVDFKYLSGSLSEYALKKLNLLLEVEPSMTV
jgi:hypothetical protein